MPLKSETILKEEADFISDNKIGGVILFDRNISSYEQLKSLINKLKDIDPYIFISIDNEGGRVQRLREPLCKSLPSMKTIARFGPEDVHVKIKDFVFTMSRDLKTFGFNLNFAPCLDVLTNLKNEVIGDRSFGSDPNIVSKLGDEFIKEFIKANIIPCGKHFPGHGDTHIDSHIDLPAVEKSIGELEKTEFIPFKYVLNKVPMIMTAHITFKAIDNLPATLSNKTISILRNWGFDKIVISDDLDMGALRKNWTISDIAVNTVKAGCDILLYCTDIESIKIGFESVKKSISSNEISNERIQQSINRIIKLKKEMKIIC